MVDVVTREYDDAAECCLDYSNIKNMTYIQKTVVAVMSLAVILGIAGVLVGLYFVLSLGIDRSEIVECNKLKGQEAEFDQFFLTKWQKEQCDGHGIFINAPVK